MPGAFGSVAILHMDDGARLRIAVKRIRVSYPTDATCCRRRIASQVSAQLESVCLPAGETLASTTETYRREKMLFETVHKHPNVLMCWCTFVSDGIGYFFLEAVRALPIGCVVSVRSSDYCSSFCFSPGHYRSLVRVASADGPDGIAVSAAGELRIPPPNRSRRRASSRAWVCSS